MMKIAIVTLVHISSKPIARASEEKGIPVNELKISIQEFSKKFKSLVRSERLMTYRFLVDIRARATKKPLRV